MTFVRIARLAAKRQAELHPNKAGISQPAWSSVEGELKPNHELTFEMDSQRGLITDDGPPRVI